VHYSYDTEAYSVDGEDTNLVLTTLISLLLASANYSLYPAISLKVARSTVSDRVRQQPTYVPHADSLARTSNEAELRKMAKAQTFGVQLGNAMPCRTTPRSIQARTS
jgi:hypothetical protein